MQVIDPITGEYHEFFRRDTVKQLPNQIIFRHGHIAITGYKPGDNREFEKTLSVWDEVTHRYYQVAGYYVKELGEFRLPRSYDTGQLAKFFPKHTPVIDNNAYFADKIDVALTTPPRDDEQVAALSFLCCKGDFKRNSRYTTLMLAQGTGSGKQMPDDTPIPTPNGWRRLDELKVGDYIFDINGYPTMVLEIFPQKGMQDVYELTLFDNRKIRCGAEHLWTVYKKSKKTVLRTKDMLDDYETVCKGGKISHKYKIPTAGPVQYPYKDVPIDPYIVGAFIGNGCLHETGLTISSGNTFVPAYIAKQLGLQTHFKPKGSYSYVFRYLDGEDHNGCVRMQTAEFFKDLPELIDAGSDTKHIPDIYKYNSVEVRRGILCGLMDTDGTIDDDFTPSYTTVSRRLRDDIVELVHSLGYGAYVYLDKRKDKYKTGECFRIDIVCPNKDKPLLFKRVPFKTTRAKAAAKYKGRANRKWMIIKKIEKVGQAKQRCITVDNPDGLYLAGDFIPTHNTYGTTASSIYLKGRTAIFIPISKLMDQWKNSYINFTSIKEDEILCVRGSAICEEIRLGLHADKKVFIFMVQTVRNYVQEYGNLKAIEMFKQTHAYLKICDEVHKEMKTVCMIEALCNFHMNYYASATPKRSATKENWIFGNLFRNCPRFGENFKTTEEKWTNIMIAQYRFTPTPTQTERMIRSRTKWLNSKLYEKELVHASDDQRKSFDNTFRSMLKWSKSQLKEGNKILVLCASIDGTEYTKKLAEDIFPGDVSTYTGQMSNKEQVEALKKTVICATSQSLGTGADIKRIQHVCMIGTYSNAVDAGQLPGRARKLDDGTAVVYYEMVNVGWYKTYKQFEKRKPFLIKASKLGKLFMID